MVSSLRINQIVGRSRQRSCHPQSSPSRENADCKERLISVSSKVEMLSYVLPVEDKAPTIVNKNHLQLNLDIQKEEEEEKKSPRNGTIRSLTSHEVMAPTTIQNFINIEQTHGAFVNGSGTGIKKIIKTHGKGPAISTESSASSLSSKASDGTSQGGGTTPTSGEKLKPKLVQNGGTKAATLKRVSFGSSKGSMVETLIYESPLQEESEVTTPTVEITAPFPPEGDSSGSDSKKVRVTFFESERPHVVLSPEPGDIIFDILDPPNLMTSASPTGIHTPQYQRQASTDSGWDNPFRPDGDLSREADEIVGLIKEGKPITPTSGNGALKTADEIDAVVPTQSKSLTASPQKGSNGTAANCEKAGVVEVQRTIVSPSGGGEIEPVVIKKKPKCKCCVIQ